jgi:hypothetical protein
MHLSPMILIKKAPAFSLRWFQPNQMILRHRQTARRGRCCPGLISLFRPLSATVIQLPTEGSAYSKKKYLELRANLIQPLKEGAFLLALGPAKAGYTPILKKFR